ncbi:MAG TPA: preprotein translocase subunit SecG [Verrucomicrobiae bacterium]|jgi:protein translocase SecG subunit|nr:preprotein translocase subunit SecG [Verrucomicrobiae bacterium]
MTILTVLFTLLLLVDCVFLGLLILIQLPKKEAGAGVAFGGGTTDALFGAGSGTALTSLTKYASAAFFVLVFVLSVLNTHASHSSADALKRSLEKQSALPPVSTTAPAPSSTPAPAPASSAAPAMPLMISTNGAAPTNHPAK